MTKEYIFSIVFAGIFVGVPIIWYIIAIKEAIKGKSDYMVFMGYLGLLAGLYLYFNGFFVEREISMYYILISIVIILIFRIRAKSEQKLKEKENLNVGT
jgi:hypothetical protein